MARHGGDGEEEALRVWLLEAGLPPAPRDLAFDRERWETVQATRPRRVEPWQVAATVAALVIVVFSVYHFRGNAARPSGSATTVTATVNGFLTAFLHRHFTTAAGFTAGGSRDEKTLETDMSQLDGLLVNQAPFTPVSAMHWKTRCTGLSCRVTFAPLDSHVVYPLDLSLRSLPNQPPRIAVADLSTWIQSLGHSTAITPSLTWRQAELAGPTWVRKPGGLPPGASNPTLVQGPTTGSLTATYTGPHGSWTIQVYEWAGTKVTLTNPAETPGTLAGVPVTTSKWHSNTGTPLAAVFFRLHGNTYQVVGIYQPLSVVERVAATLIR